MAAIFRAAPGATCKHHTNRQSCWNQDCQCSHSQCGFHGHSLTGSTAGVGRVPSDRTGCGTCARYNTWLSSYLCKSIPKSLTEAGSSAKRSSTYTPRIVHRHGRSHNGGNIVIMATHDTRIIDSCRIDRQRDMAECVNKSQPTRA
jgi:hypothetical protein